MIVSRTALLSLATLVATVCCVGHAAAQSGPQKPPAAAGGVAKKTVGKSGKADKTTEKAKDKAKDKADAAAPGGGKPLLSGSYGDWQAFTAHAGKDKTCYALSQPKDRQPAGLTRDPGYLFISRQPGRGVTHEISFIMGFPLKDKGEGSVGLGAESWPLFTSGKNAWVKNAADEEPFLETMRRGSRLVVKAPSAKGNVTTDAYSLTGFKESYARVLRDCP